MARKLRCSILGRFTTVNRGDRREAIFVNDADRHLFLDTLGEA